jgi:Protein of unknown function (DUF5131)
VKTVKYDEIGYWSELNLDIVRKYATAYSTILNKQRSIRKHLYVDAFAGAGKHISKKTGDFVAGSSRNALLIDPPFSEVHHIDLDQTKAAQLRKDIGDRQDVYIHRLGDRRRRVRPRCTTDETIRDQCLKADVPFFFKQWGGVWKKRFGRQLEGRTWDQMPKSREVTTAVA